MSSDSIRMWKQAYARIPAERRAALEAEFQQHDRRAMAVAGLAQARGQEMELHEWVQARIDFVGRQMATQRGLSTEEFLGLAHHMIMEKAGSRASNRGASAGQTGGCAIWLLALGSILASSV